MTSPGGRTVSWNLHANDQISSVLERLDRRVDTLARSMDHATTQTRQFGRSLETVKTGSTHITTAVTTTESHMGRLRASLGTVAAGVSHLAIMGGTVLVGALATGGVAAATWGLKMAAANESAMISFTTMLGSAEKASAFLVKLKSFAAATPFDLPSLRNAASRLLAVGVAAKDVIPLMTRLGDATAAMGTGAEGIGRAVYALQQIRQAGRAQQEDLNQLTDAGIPIMEALAARLHTTVAKIRKEFVQKGLITADIIYDTILKGSGKSFQRLNGMMAQQALTLEGLWSTFKDNLGQTLAGMMEPAIPAIKKVLDWASTAIPDAILKMQSAFKSAGKNVKDFLAGTDVDEKFMAAMKALGELILPELKRAWDNIVKTVRDNKQGLEEFGRLLAETVIPVVGVLLVGAIRILAMSMMELIVVTAHITDAFQAMAHSAIFALRSMVDGAAFAIGGLGMKLIPGLEDAKKRFDKWADSMDKRIDELDGKSITINLRVSSSAQYRKSMAQLSAMPDFQEWGGMPRRAAGGPVTAGEWYRVGEKGPENVYMPRNGYVYPNSTGGGGSSGIIGTLVVKYLGPNGEEMRQELLTLKRQRGLLSLGF